MAKQDILNKLADSHEERIIGALKKLEDEIILDLSKITSPNELKLSTKVAIQFRQNLKSLIEKNFLTEVDDFIRKDYDQIVKEYLSFARGVKLPERFVQLTKPDLELINNLKFLTFANFEEISTRFLNVMGDELYQSAIVGKPFPEVVKSIRGHLNGVFQRSNENAINRLVSFVEKNRYNKSKSKQVKNAVSILNTKYASDRLGNNMRKYSTQLAQDSIMQFDGQFTKHKAVQAGITKFKYTGTLITDSRDFCRDHLGKIYTEEEARDIWQGRSWTGKSGSDPFVHRGGYNCRHSFILYDDEWADLIKE